MARSNFYLQAAVRRAARRVSVGTVASAAEAGPPPAIGGDGPANEGSAAAELVTSLLGKIEGTNRGVDCTPEQQEEIDGIIDQVCLRSAPWRQLVSRLLHLNRILWQPKRGQGVEERAESRLPTTRVSP